MPELLVVSGGADATAELVADSAVALGIDTTFVDLRRHQLDLAVGRRGATVTSGGRALRPAVVINATSTNSLGLAGPDVLSRQRSMRWQHRNAAAREEQGLLLGVFAAFGSQGARLVNSAEAADLALMPNAVTERLDRVGVAVNRGHDASAAELLVAGGRVIGHRGPDLDAIDLAVAVSDAAEFEFGSVTVTTRSSGLQVVTGWNHRPNLLDWPEPARAADWLLRSFPELEPGRRPGAAGGFFVGDLGQSRPG